MTVNIAIDLTDVDMFVRGEHHAALAWLRDNQPIYWNEGADGNSFWALTRYDDVLWAYLEHAALGSERGAILGGSYRSEGDTAGGRMLVATDLPRHRLLKQVIHPAFLAAVADRIGNQVRRLVDEALTRARADGSCDFAHDVAAQLPAAALMVVMGISYEEARHLIALTHRMVGFRDDAVVSTGGDQRLRLAWLQAEIFEFLADLVAHRSARPGDDLISLLLRGQVNGRALSTEDVLYNCLNVAVGGNETTAYTACAGIEALLESGQYDIFLRNRAALESDIDEILRWTTVNAYVQRVAKTDIVRGGVRIAKGDSVTLWNVSANRDERQFPHPDRFDVHRDPNRHLAFGAGIHRCIGAQAGRRELVVLLEQVRASGLRFEMTAPPSRMRSNFILGITHMPVDVL